MNTVTVKKADLLKRIKENRTKHAEAVKEAQVGYREAVIKELDRMLLDAREGRRIQIQVHLPVPVDHTREYDQIVDQLEMSVDTDITLDTHSFNAYVRDEWEWNRAFATSNTRYVKSPATMDYMEGKLRSDQ